MSFKGKVVLITGGSAGIGATTAEMFAKEGAAVVIVGRNEEKLNSVAEKCQKYGAITLSIKADVFRDQEADTIVQKTIDKFGKLDILVNNAGILKEAGLLDDKFLETFEEVMNVNMRSVIRITHFAAPYVIKSKGNIVIISSTAGIGIGNPIWVAYNTSKAALNHFSKCVALELAPYGVRVNTISPGPVRTHIVDGTSLKSIVTVAKHTALQRISETEEIADLILYLASDKAKGITGSNLVSDNGMLLNIC